MASVPTSLQPTVTSPLPKPWLDHSSNLPFLHGPDSEPATDTWLPPSPKATPQTVACVPSPRSMAREAQRLKTRLAYDPLFHVQPQCTQHVTDFKRQKSESVRFIERVAERKVIGSCNSREKVLVVKVIPGTAEGRGLAFPVHGFSGPWCQDSEPADVDPSPSPCPLSSRVECGADP